MPVLPEQDRGEELLAEFLAERDVACPLCGYNLRSLTGDRRPECGHEVRLSVALKESALGPHVAALAAWCFGSGAGLLLSTVGLFNASPQWWWSAGGVTLLIATLVNVTGLCLFMARRRDIRRWRHEAQRLFAILSWAAVVVSGVCVVALFKG